MNTKVTAWIAAWSMVAAAFCPAGRAQTVTETVLGHITIQGPRRPLVSLHADHVAIRERVDGKERYVTFQGPGTSYDRIQSGAVWIKDRLVYFAVKGGKAVLVDGPKEIPLKGTPTSPVVLPWPWPSSDATSYCAFVSDDKSIGWYRDGVLQTTRFDSLPFVPITAPPSVPFFVGKKKCMSQVVGHPPSAKASWDLLHWVRSTPDGSVVFVYGERAGIPLLHRNGKEVLRELITSFENSVDGKTWLAVIDRPIDGAPNMVILQDGQQVAQAAAYPLLQNLFVATDGSTWIWKIIDDDNKGVTLKQAGKADRRLEPVPLEFYLSPDGKREAYLQVTNDTPARVQFTVAGVPVSSQVGVDAGSFRFGPGDAYAFIANPDDKVKSVISQLGEGPKFETITPISFLPDGRPVYVGSNVGERYIVVGTTAKKIEADDLLGLTTLRIVGTTVVVLGMRGDDFIEFKLTPN
jgi:hypothetical protein